MNCVRLGNRRAEDSGTGGKSSSQSLLPPVPGSSHLRSTPWAQWGERSLCPCSRHLCTTKGVVFLATFARAMQVRLARVLLSTPFLSDASETTEQPCLLWSLVVCPISLCVGVLPEAALSYMGSQAGSSYKSVGNPCPSGVLPRSLIYLVKCSISCSISMLFIFGVLWN